MAPPQNGDAWTILVHLSDIHFRSFHDNTYAFQRDLQNELTRDASAFCETHGAANAILVCGDVAFSGQTAEFEDAAKWLAHLAETTGTRPDRVFTIPGNHDVVRSIIETSQLLKMIHKDLRPVDPDAVNERLDKYLTKDREAAELLLRPLANYNAFAARFECDLSPAKHFWEHNLMLNDGSILRLRGINSSIASDEGDDDGANRLCVGSEQFTLERVDGVEYLTLCHHPPPWLRDQDALEDQLNNRARVQLFGHKHRQRATRINDSIRLTAGAVGPPPREPRWQPCYNFLLIKVEQRAKRTMLVQVHQRVWNEQTASFVSSAGEVPFQEYDLCLPAFVAIKGSGAGTVEPAELDLAAAPTSSPPVARDHGEVMDARRLLTYRFLTLPYAVRFEIAQSLNLLDEQDRGLSETETYRLWFKRAADGNQLPALWDAVDQKYGQDRTPNPFRKE